MSKDKDLKAEDKASDDVSVKDESYGVDLVSEDVCKEEVDTKTLPYKDNYYLLYGSKKGRGLDLKGTSKLLCMLGFDGGELHQARNGKDTSKIYIESEDDGSNKMFCSYCGSEILGVEYQRLNDGRLRCTVCSNSVVKSEVNEILNRVLMNMETFFGAAIAVPIHIEFLDERNLKKKIKCPISVVDDKSILVLGAASNNKKQYSIYLENGAPRISVIATFAHELTHIWQYIHWDSNKGFQKCTNDKRLMIYEGMAKWVEIQYLYLIGETIVAKREEFIPRNRYDEEGLGLRLYE